MKLLLLALTLAVLLYCSWALPARHANKFGVRKERKGQKAWGIHWDRSFSKDGGKGGNRRGGGSKDSYWTGDDDIGKGYWTHDDDIGKGYWTHDDDIGKGYWTHDDDIDKGYWTHDDDIGKGYRPGDDDDGKGYWRWNGYDGHTNDGKRNDGGNGQKRFERPYGR